MRRRKPFASLLLSLPLLQAPAPVPRADQVQHARALTELVQRIEEEKKSWLEFKKQATDEAERAALIEAFPRDDFARELVAIAAGSQGTETAARAWMTLFELGTLLDDPALFEQGLEHMLAEHMASPHIASLTLGLAYGAPPWSAPRAQDALRRILAGTDDKNIQAAALVELALLVGLDDALGDAGRAEAETLLARIEKDYASDDFNGMTGKQFASGARHEIERLRVGQVAPDFEVTDQDGVRFKLSDYRGRVVLLDFWGFV